MSPQTHKILTNLLLASLAVFAPVRGMVATVVILTLVDAVTGVIAAAKTGQHITSHGFRRTVGKLVVYQTALLTGFLAEVYLMPIMPVSKVVAGAIGLTEFKSILENLGRISGQPIIKMILGRLDARPASKDSDGPAGQ